MNAPQQRIMGLIVHKLIKERQLRAEVVPRNAIVQVNEPVERLVTEIHRLYSEKTGKGYGKFEANEDNFPMPRLVREYFNDHSIDFYQLSIRMMDVLKDRADTERLSTGGYVLIAHVTNGATDFLLVAIVTDKIGTAITEGLDIVDSPHLDLAALRVAGRVDATAWRAGNERYISFLKGRGEVSDYFKHFLGCNDVVMSAAETKKLISCLKSFATDRGMDQPQRDQLLRQTHEYCTQCADAKQPLSLDALANRLMPDDPNALRTVFAAEGVQLSDGFVPDKKSLRSLVRFKGKTKAWTVEFDRDALQSGDLEFDTANRTLILHNLPEGLLHEMIEERRDEQ
jgi:nucleoid-associated protein